jgi:hypothetical protein
MKVFSCATIETSWKVIFTNSGIQFGDSGRLYRTKNEMVSWALLALLALSKGENHSSPHPPRSQVRSRVRRVRRQTVINILFSSKDGSLLNFFYAEFFPPILLRKFPSQSEISLLFFPANMSRLSLLPSATWFQAQLDENIPSRWKHFKWPFSAFVIFVTSKGQKWFQPFLCSQSLETFENRGRIEACF